MTWLVTGGSGFLGRHVLTLLQDRGERVVALGRKRPSGCPIEEFRRADLNDASATAQAVHHIAPDHVIHAAGKTPPAASPDLYLANVRATMTLFDAIRQLDRPCRVVLAGSAAELGPVPAEHLPANEDCPCRPTDAYGLSKWAATRLGQTQTAPLEVMIGRIFNLIGPGTPIAQAFGRFAAALADPETAVMKVGDLDARRDFIDVRDAASALIALAEQGTAKQVYHIGTGESHSVREGLGELIRLSGRSVYVEEASARRGPSDSTADNTRIRGQTGWQPVVSWSQSLSDLWAEVCRRSASRLVA
jgi:GDP-4-dehydro-6-deoxy-D-mannose reductase